MRETKTRSAPPRRSHRHSCRWRRIRRSSGRRRSRRSPARCWFRRRGQSRGLRSARADRGTRVGRGIGAGRAAVGAERRATWREAPGQTCGERCRARRTQEARCGSFIHPRRTSTKSEASHRPANGSPHYDERRSTIQWFGASAVEACPMRGPLGRNARRHGGKRGNLGRPCTGRSTDRASGAAPVPFEPSLPRPIGSPTSHESRRCVRRLEVATAERTRRGARREVTAERGLKFRVNLTHDPREGGGRDPLRLRCPRDQPSLGARGLPQAPDPPPLAARRGLGGEGERLSGLRVGASLPRVFLPSFDPSFPRSSVPSPPRGQPLATSLAPRDGRVVQARHGVPGLLPSAAASRREA